jgi:hypothetical protein
LFRDSPLQVIVGTARGSNLFSVINAGTVAAALMLVDVVVFALVL